MTIEITIVIRGSLLEDTEATGPRARIRHGGVGGAALGAGQSVPGEGARGHLRVPGAVEIPCCSPCLFQGNFPRGPCLAGPSPRATESLGFSSCFPGIEGRAGRVSAPSPPSALPRFCSLPTPFLLFSALTSAFPAGCTLPQDSQGSIRLIWVPGVCCPMKGEQVWSCFPSQHCGGTQDGGLDSQSCLGWSFSGAGSPVLLFFLFPPPSFLPLGGTFKAGVLSPSCLCITA